MDLIKETPYGRITISERVFTKILLDVMQEDDLKDRVWAATKKGRIIDEDAPFAETDTASMITIERDDEGRMLLSLSIVVKFGESIKEICSILNHRLARLIEKHDGKLPGRITITVSGVKGRLTVKRNMEIVTEYEAQ